VGRVGPDNGALRSGDKNMVEVTGFFGFLLLVLIVYAVVKTVQSDASTLGKVIWVVLLLMLPVLGFILWLLFGPKG
jgi:hypothetical protein